VRRKRSIIAPFVGVWVLGSAAVPTSAQEIGQTGAAMVVDTDSQSIGNTENGRLLRAFAIEPSDTVAVVRPNHYGTRELVGLLGRAADSVARAFAGSRLAVGDLSSQFGGPLAPHGSHQSGRDVDVGFFVVDVQGQPVPQSVFMEIRHDGSGRRADAQYRFDDARNWALLVAFVDDPMAEVQHVLIASHLRARLLDYARRTSAPEDQIHRVDVVTSPIRGSEVHDNHFHVRIYCSVGDRPECLDRPPLHPWYDGTPSPQAVLAARVADMQRADALRRDQEVQRVAELSLLEQRAMQEAMELVRARELAAEPARQLAEERRRAAALSRDEQTAILELRRMEAEGQREQIDALGHERGRASALAAEQRRWMESERRRATSSRALARRREAEARRRAVLAERRRIALLRRVAAQQAADRRRTTALQRRAEELRRERFAAGQRVRATDPARRTRTP